MDRTGRGDQPEEVDRPALSEASTLIEGRWRSLDEKVAWMLKGREQVDDSSELAEHASTRDAPSSPDMVLTPSFPRDIRIPSEDLKRAGLPDLSDRAVTLYLATHRQDRPWLNIVGAYDSAALRRAIATMDQGGGHTLERHSPSGSAEDHKRRVERLEDPAQTDPQLREQGVDGLTGKEHYCADSQSRFTDVGAMTTALARALADPKLKAALETPYTRRDTPGDVVIPIADLLGADGHLSCEGFRLAGEPKVALAERRAWAKERRDWLRQHGTVDGFASEPPPAERIPSFEGGTIRFRIWHNKDQTGYEISSFYPEAATEKGSSSR